MKTGLVAEIETVQGLCGAAAELVRRGYTELDAWSPYPVPQLDGLLGLRRSPLGWILFPIALVAAAIGYGIQWYTSVIDYPINVGGRPLHSAPAFVPITFETMVLFTGVLGFFIMLGLARLVRLYRPIFDVPGFESASIDRHWIGIDDGDPKFDEERAKRDLAEVGGTRITRVTERRP